MTGLGPVAGFPVVVDGGRALVYNPWRREFATVAVGDVRDAEVERAIVAQWGAAPAPGILPAPEAGRALALAVTETCNLQCRYCFADSHPGREGRMSPEAAAWAVRGAAALGPVTAVHFIGGEPTLNMPAIKAAVAVAQNLQRPPPLFVTTNGTAPRASHDWLLDAGFAFSVSWDGPRSRISRPYASGRDSAPDAETAIRYLAPRAGRLRVRLTLSRHNLDCLDDAVAWCGDAGVRYLHVEPWLADGRGLESREAIPDPGAFVSAFFSVLDLAEGLGVALLTSALSDLFTPGVPGCPSTRGNMLHFHANGSVSHCYKVSDSLDPRTAPFVVGRYVPAAGGLDLDPVACAELGRRNASGFASCRACALRPICGGGCTLRHAKGGAGGDVDPWTCALRAGMIQRALVYLDACARSGRKGSLAIPSDYYAFVSNVDGGRSHALPHSHA